MSYVGLLIYIERRAEIVKALTEILLESCGICSV
jgi:hypothetical protein